MSEPSARRRPVIRGSDPFDWKWIRNILMLHRLAFFSILLLTGVVYAAGLAIPICSQRAVDLISSRQNLPGLMVLFVFAVVSVIVESGLSYWREQQIIFLGAFLEQSISRRMYLHLMRLSLEGSRLGIGDILNRFQQITKLREFCMYRFPQTGFDLGAAIIAFGAVFYYDVSIGIYVGVLTVLTAIALGGPLKGMRNRSFAFVKANGARQETLSESVYGLDTLKTLATEEFHIRKWVNVTRLTLNQMKGLLRFNRAVMTSTQLASRLISLLVIVVGCWHISNGRLTVGQLIALQLLAARASGPLLTGGGDFFRALHEANVAITQIDEFLRQPTESLPALSPPANLERCPIFLDRVSYRYPDSNGAAIDNVSITLPESGVIAVIGRNGSGKSTLIKILSGIHRDYSGQVHIGSQLLQAIHPRGLRKQISVVPQDTVLFSDTVRANLTLGRPARDAELRQALEFAGATGFVDALPDGIDTVLDNGGRNLSGGQRQRLSIARAVVRDPKIVFLDEPTAFLDAEAAVELEERLMAWGKSRLLILVTHNLAIARNADQIVMLDAGKMVGQGSHEFLLSSVSEYASLWKHFVRSLASGSEHGELATMSSA